MLPGSERPPPHSSITWQTHTAGKQGPVRFSRAAPEYIIGQKELPYLRNMKPAKTLPSLYQLESTLNLAKNKRLTIYLSILSIIVFILAWGGFTWLAAVLRQTENIIFSFTIGQSLIFTFVALLTILLVMVIHEAIHGIFLWVFTKEKPLFGVKQLYAYAAAPGWFLPRTPYFIVALAPLALITIAGVLLLPVISDSLLPFLLIFITYNFSGAVGDIAVVLWLLKKPRSIYINDFGDGVNIYTQSVTHKENC